MDERQERSEERRKPRKAAPGYEASKPRPKKRPDNTGLEQRRKKKRPADAEERRHTTDTENRRRTAGTSQRRRPSPDPAARPTDNRRARSVQERQPVRAVKKKKRSYGLVIVIILLLIAAIGIGAVFLWMRYGPSNEEADRDEYYGIENENQLAIIVNNEVIGAQGMIADGTAYVNYETVRDYINSRFYWDSNENVLLYTLPTDMISVGVGSSEYTVSKNKQSKDYVILKTDGSQAYIALDFIKEHTDLDYSVYKDPNRAMIVTETGEITVAAVKSDSQVRRLAGVKSPILTEVKKKDKVTIIENEGDWKKVRTQDGYVGYIKESALKSEETETITREFQEEVFTNISKDYTINLAWHQVTNESANENVLQILAEAKGLNTISPTWFTVADNNGSITSTASADYVNYAHQANVEVWALVDNFGEGIDSYELLSHTSRRDNLTNQLIAEVLKKNIDGINVDFEQISQETGEHYIQFIRELSIKCRQNGIILSVDNYVPGYTSYYNRKEQGIVADYVIIMGYDEYYSGSYEAGPVASIDYVREGITSTLEEVPKEKVINAVPFYTRLWSETPKTEEELAADKGTEAENYPNKVTSQALGMTEAENAVAQAGVTAEWDETVQMDYAQWEADGVTYKIWLENAGSLEAKLALMKENQLAGTAAWKIGFEKSEIWDLIQRYVN